MTMPKFSLHIEADSLAELFSFFELPPTRRTLDPRDEPANEPAAAPPPAAAAPKKAAPAKATPKAAAAKTTTGNGPVSSARAALEASVDATDPSVEELPPLEYLKSIVSTAIRLAQKNEGDQKVLEHLQNFKTKTGLPFVMNSTEEHRAALYDLAVASGLPVV
jgi:hypothetical protein